MIVKCTRCATRLKVKDEKIKPGGSSFKCPKCGAILLLKKPVPTVKKEAKSIKKPISPQVAKHTKPLDRKPLPRHTKQVPIKTKPSLLQNIFAVVLLIGIIGALGTLIWAKTQSKYLYGPDNMASLGDTVFIHFNHTLYQLNSQGELQNIIKLSDLGIEGLTSDIQILNNGNVLIGDADSANIYQCNLETLDCWVIVPADIIKHPFKFYADESTGLLYITDTMRHRLLVQEIDGTDIQEVADRKLLKYPNEILADNEGLVYIADTNHHRIVTLEILDNKAEEIDTPVRIGDLSRPGHKWPFAFARSPEGNWWILNVDLFFENADLIVYDSSGEAIQRILIPDDADPASVAFVGNQVVVTDLEHMQVYTIDPQTVSINNFGDTEFQTALKDFRERKQTNSQILSGAYILLLLCIVGILVLIVILVISSQKNTERVYPL